MKAKIVNANRSRKRRSQRQTRLWKVWRRRRQRLKQRLDKHQREPHDGLSGEQPVLQGSNVDCEMGERQTGTAYGGVAVMHQLVRELGLAQAIS